MVSRAHVLGQHCALHHEEASVALNIIIGPDCWISIHSGKDHNCIVLDASDIFFFFWWHANITRFAEITQLTLCQDLRLGILLMSFTSLINLPPLIHLHTKGTLAVVTFQQICL